MLDPPFGITCSRASDLGLLRFSCHAEPRPPYIYIMQPFTSRTRSSTLQDHQDAYQNGGTSVRSTAHLAVELHPVHLSTREEDNLEGDYFDELRSPEIIMTDHLCTNDYDLDMSDHVDALPITSPAAERLFGGDDGYQAYGRKQRRSMTDRTDTLSEIDSRPSKAIAVQKVASPIDSTRPVLPQLFGLSGQTELLQAQTEVKRGRTEKDSQFESVARDLLYEMKAMKTAFGATL